jgi:cytochrome oxidase assembly protein ShyY1
VTGRGSESDRSAVRVPPFLRSPRWIAGHAIVLVIVTGCVIAGFWQLDRLHQRRAANERIEARLAEAPVSLDDLVASGSGHVDSLVYRRVRATGSYDVEHETVLIGRTLDEETGNDLLTPLVISAGDGLIVNRGWVPYSLDAPPVQAAIPPTGPVEVSGVLMPPEATSPAASASPSPTVATVDLGRLQAGVPYRLLPVYLWLQSQSPQGASLPREVPLPELSEGPHLSYSIQWFAFAAIGIIGYPLLIRREIRRRRAPEVESA